MMNTIAFMMVSSTTKTTPTATLKNELKAMRTLTPMSISAKAQTPALVPVPAAMPAAATEAVAGPALVADGSGSGRPGLSAVQADAELP